MINHYRTLLLNETDQGNPNEYIAPNYTAIALPYTLQQFYNVLFPLNTSRNYKQFLAYCYINLLYAANQTQFLKSYDNRLTYTQSEITDYFMINSISNPIISNPAFQLFLFGTYAINSSFAKNYDDIVINQVSGVNVTIYSKINNIYFGTQSVSQNPVTIAVGATPTTIIGTGLTFLIDNYLNLSSYSGLSWEFLASAPYNFSFNSIYNQLQYSQTVANLLSYQNFQFDTTSINLWKQHYNPVYQFAGLLNCYVQLVNLVNTSNNV